MYLYWKDLWSLDYRENIQIFVDVENEWRPIIMIKKCQQIIKNLELKNFAFNEQVTKK